MQDTKNKTWLSGVVGITMTAVFWHFYCFPPDKVDSFLQSLPLLAPLSWIEVWFTVAFVLGVRACARCWRSWLVAPLFTAITAAVFFVRALE